MHETTQEKEMIEIKNRFTNQNICSAESIREAVEKYKNNLRDADLCGADLCDADLRGADLYDANLYDANLRDADLRGADLRGANLRGANLRGANLRGADLRGADLRDANLYDADLRGADLRGADLYDANLYGANLRGADLRDALIDGEKIKKNPINITCGLKYIALITDRYMRLGCKRFTHDAWENFSDKEISTMDSGALEFWNQWKHPLLAMCKAHRGE